MLTKQEKMVTDLIDKHRDDILRYLRRLIGFKTITPQVDEKAEGDDYVSLQNFIKDTLDEMNFDTDIWEIDPSELDDFPGSGVDKSRDMSNMPVLAGKLRGTGNGRSLILNGHYDVVPPGIIENWKHDPFRGEIADGKLYGRGANDMKGGITAMIQAIRFIRMAGTELGGDIIVETVPDEEQTCMGTLSCCQKGYVADAAIIPEPTDMKILVAVRGSVYGKIEVYGRAGHAEMPQPHWMEGGAVNAISKAMKVMTGLEDLTEEWRTRPDKQHRFLAPDYIMPTIIKGGEWPVTYPEKVEISFSSMHIPSSKNTEMEIEQKLASVADNDSWLRENPPKLTVELRQYGAEVDESEPIVQVGKEALTDMGIEPVLRGYGTLTDSIHLINLSKVPTISIGPDIKTAHMADEFVTVEQLIDTTKVLALAIMRWSS